MILTTVQQAKNFVLYALDTNPMYDELSADKAAFNAKVDVQLVFGMHTFTQEQLQEIVDYAIEVVLSNREED
jgi:hypothetical protein